MAVAETTSRGSPRRSAPRDDALQGGFTLLEVLVAIVLLGFAYAGILSALSQGLKLARAAADQENAVVLARSLLEENRALPKAEIVGSDVREAYGGTPFGYKVEVRDVPMFADIPADKVKPTFELKRITVDVYWGEREPKRHYRLSTVQSLPLLGADGSPQAAEGSKPGSAPPPTTPNTPAASDAKKT